MSDKYIKLDDVLRKVGETIDFTAQYGVHIGGLRGDISSLPTIELTDKVAKYFSIIQRKENQ